MYFFVSCQGPCAPKEKWYRKEHITRLVVVVVVVVVAVAVVVVCLMGLPLASVQAVSDGSTSVSELRSPLPGTIQQTGGCQHR